MGLELDLQGWGACYIVVTCSCSDSFVSGFDRDAII